jgi:hypothetical protein
MIELKASGGRHWNVKKESEYSLKQKQIVSLSGHLDDVVSEGEARLSALTTKQAAVINRCISRMIALEISFQCLVHDESTAPLLQRLLLARVAELVPDLQNLSPSRLAQPSDAASAWIPPSESEWKQSQNLFLVLQQEKAELSSALTSEVKLRELAETNMRSNLSKINLKWTNKKIMWQKKELELKNQLDASASEITELKTARQVDEQNLIKHQERTKSLGELPLRVSELEARITRDALSISRLEDENMALKGRLDSMHCESDKHAVEVTQTCIPTTAEV